MDRHNKTKPFLLNRWTECPELFMGRKSGTPATQWINYHINITSKVYYYTLKQFSHNWCMLGFPEPYYKDTQWYGTLQ